MSGKVESRPASMAEHQVERDGEKRDAWMKAMRLEIVSVERVELAVCSTSVGLVSSCVPGRSSCQSRDPVVGERVPDRIGTPCRVIESWDVSKTSTLLEVKRAVQPWSQSWPMEMSDPEARDGKMWAEAACDGSDGRGRVAVWLEDIDPPIGAPCRVIESWDVLKTSTLADGDERSGSERWKDVGGSGLWWKRWEGEGDCVA